MQGKEIRMGSFKELDIELRWTANQISEQLEDQKEIRIKDALEGKLVEMDINPEFYVDYINNILEDYIRR